MFLDESVGFTLLSLVAQKVSTELRRGILCAQISMLEFQSKNFDVENLLREFQYGNVGTGISAQWFRCENFGTGISAR